MTRGRVYLTDSFWFVFGAPPPPPPSTSCWWLSSCSPRALTLCPDKAAGLQVTFRPSEVSSRCHSPPQGCTHTQTERIRHAASLLKHLSHMHTALLTHQRRTSWTQTRSVITSHARHIKSRPGAHHSSVKLKVSHPKLAICCRPVPRMRQKAKGKSAESFNLTEKNRMWMQK